jgi:hypothetical protein
LIRPKRASSCTISTTGRSSSGARSWSTACTWVPKVSFHSTCTSGSALGCCGRGVILCQLCRCSSP